MNKATRPGDNQQEPSKQEMESGFGFGSSGDDDPALSWRLQPDDSLSDYTIVVHRTPEDSTAGSEIGPLGVECDTYHVHKVVLAVGCRKSRYFERMLKSSAHFLESTSNTSHVTLHPLAADMMPSLLDYMYFQSFPLSLDTYSATPLHFLSDYFDIRNLRRDVEVFCQFDMAPTNCHIYYTHASMLNDASMLAAVLRLCVQQSGKVSRNHDMFRVAPADLWVKVLEIKATSESPESSSGSSSLVETFLRVKADYGDREDFTPELFKALTDPARLTRIDTATCALAILTWDKHFASIREAEDRDRRSDGARSLSKLQRRCVKALGRILVAEVPATLQPQWHSFIFGSIRECGGRLHHALVASVVEMGIDRMARGLKALSIPADPNDEGGGGDDDHEARGSRKRTRSSASAA